MVIFLLSLAIFCHVTVIAVIIIKFKTEIIIVP